MVIFQASYYHYTSEPLRSCNWLCFLFFSLQSYTWYSSLWLTLLMVKLYSWILKKHQLWWASAYDCSRYTPLITLGRWEYEFLLFLFRVNNFSNISWWYNGLLLKKGSSRAPLLKGILYCCKLQAQIVDELKLLNLITIKR